MRARSLSSSWALAGLAAAWWLALPAAQAPGGGLRVALVGQALIHDDLRHEAPDAVAQARDYLRGFDVAFTNLETSIAPPGVSRTPRSATAVPAAPEVLDCLREMGFNLLSLANNHAADRLVEGMADTRQEVSKRGFAFAGTGKNAADAAAAGYLETKAGKVALVAMASGAAQLTPDTWATSERGGVNFLELRKDGTLNPEQQQRILEAVRTAARQASLVIVYQHNHYWGDRRGIEAPPGRETRISRFATPPWMEQWARQLIDAGAHLYVAHGNPALHGVEIYKGRLIVYGLGNYIFQSAQTIDRYGPLAWYSALVDATFTAGRVTGVRFTPLVLGMEGKARGAPYVAQGGEADAVLERLASQSKPYGTEIRIDQERAEVVLR